MPFSIDNPMTAALLAAKGVSLDRVQRILPYDYSITWASVSPSSSAVGQVTIDNGTPFVVTEYAFTAWLLAADTNGGANMPAFTQLSRRAGDTRLVTASGALGNSMYSLAGLRIQLGDSTDQAWSVNPQRVLNMFGRTENRLPLIQRVIAGGASVQGTLFNDLVFTAPQAQIGAELVLSGYRVFYGR